MKDLQQNQDLYSSPTQPALLIHFPSMVVGGMSYAIGKTMYEAQNQAAVSGSCMLNLHTSSPISLIASLLGPINTRNFRPSLSAARNLSWSSGCIYHVGAGCALL